MTAEQIKQNAEEYANTRKYTLDELDNSILTVEEIVKLAYITGADSRDEEIKKLKNAIDSLKRENGQLKIDKEYWKESAMEYINRDNEKY